MSNKFHGDTIVGSTDVTLGIKLVLTDGTDATGIAATAVTAYYWRQGASSIVQVTVTAAASLGAAHSDGKWWEVGSNMPGIYQLHFPDAPFASGADWVVIDVTATGCKHFQITLYLDTFNTDANGLVKLQPVTHTSAVIPTVTTLTGNTPQTGDSYAVVNNATYGNAKLVRSTTPANTLTVNASNQASIDGSTITMSSTERNAIADAFLARALGTESYAALSAIPTVKEALYQLLSMWFHTTSGTTVTFKKLNMSDASEVATLSPNATAPTSILRTS